MTTTQTLPIEVAPPISDEVVLSYRALLKNRGVLNVTIHQANETIARAMRANLQLADSIDELTQEFDFASQRNPVVETSKLAADLENGVLNDSHPSLSRALKAYNSGNGYKKHLAGYAEEKVFEARKQLSDKKKSLRSEARRNRQTITRFDQLLYALKLNYESTQKRIAEIREQVQSPLELLTSSERLDLFNGAKQDPAFKQYYEAYARATNATANQPNAELSKSEWKMMFDSMTKDAPKVRFCSEELKDPGIYFFDKTGNPRRNPNGSAITFEQLFFLPKQQPQPVIVQPTESVKTPVPETTPSNGSYLSKVWAKITSIYR